jgi:hypothetical protein
LGLQQKQETPEYVTSRLEPVKPAASRSFISDDLLRFTECESLNGKKQTPLEVAESCGRHPGFLHTWANQLEIVGLGAQLNGTWQELREFSASQGY